MCKTPFSHPVAVCFYWWETVSDKRAFVWSHLRVWNEFLLSDRLHTHDHHRYQICLAVQLRSLDLELRDSCSHNFNGCTHGFYLRLTCTINSLSAHFSLSSLRCLSVSIFFLTLQLLLYPILQSSYNPVDLILQAVAMEIMVISQFQCCKHCRRQWKRWLARDILRIWGQFRGVVSESVLRGWLYNCGVSVCVFSSFISFSFFFFFVKVFLLEAGS